MFAAARMFDATMTTALLGGVVAPVLIGAGVLGFLLRRSARSRLRRSQELTPGHVVIASNLVSSRWQ